MKLVLVIAELLIIVSASMAAPAEVEELAKTLPATLGTFRRVRDPKVIDLTTKKVATSEYVAPGKGRFTLEIHHFPQDGKAYEFFTATAQMPDLGIVEVSSHEGTSSFILPAHVGLYKGSDVVLVYGKSGLPDKEMLALTTGIVSHLDRGEGDIPALIKHLPNWEQAQQTAVYLNRFVSLNEIATDGVLTAINSEGDADAVMAKYDSMRLLIIEFNTPQRSVENDQRVVARIQELWKLGQPAPSAYRRIGNYSVFVFDAPNEQAAKQLIDQVHYEQVVSWLGENPNILKEAQRHYVRTTLGVLVAVLKASGFALIACLGTGGLIGALLFTRRRAQQRTADAFSDAGGMLRLNLDEMTPQTDPARLLGPTGST